MRRLKPSVWARSIYSFTEGQRPCRPRASRVACSTSLVRRWLPGARPPECGGGGSSRRRSVDPGMPPSTAGMRCQSSCLLAILALPLQELPRAPPAELLPGRPSSRKAHRNHLGGGLDLAPLDRRAVLGRESALGHAPTERCQGAARLATNPPRRGLPLPDCPPLHPIALASGNRCRPRAGRVTRSRAFRHYVVRYVPGGRLRVYSGLPPSCEVAHAHSPRRRQCLRFLRGS